MRNRGQINPKGDGKWLVRVYVGREAGKRKYASKVVTGTFKQADQELTKMLREQDTGTFVEPSKLTLGAYLTQWLETKHGLAPKTLRDYEHRIEKDVLPALSLRPLSKITPLVISQLIRSLISDRELSPRTVRYTHAVLHQAFEQAVAWNMIARNPCAHVELPEMEQGGGGDTLSFEETAQFLDHAAQKGDRLFALWRVLLSAGLRPAEALALKWSDFDGQALLVFRALKEVKAGVWEPKNLTKTGTGRNVPLGPETIEALQQHRKAQAVEMMKRGSKYVRNDFIFATRTGHFFTPPNVRRWWYAALESAKVRKVRLYDARHTNISQELAAGGNVKEVADRHGHADPNMTLRVYAHHVPGFNSGTPMRVEQMIADARKKAKEA